MKRCWFLAVALAAVVSGTARADRGEIAALISRFHGDYPAQKAASEKLIALGPQAVPDLIALCEDANESMRWHAVDLLGAIADARGLDALVKRVLEDTDVHVRWRSIWAVGAMDCAVVGVKLVAALGSEEARIRWNAAVALATMGRREAVPVLHAGLDAASEWMQWEAVNGLGSVHDEKTAAALIPKLTSGYASVAREAILSLGRLKDPAAVAPLIGALRHPDAEMRWRAAMALERIGDVRGLPALKEQLTREKDSSVRRQLQESMRQFGK
jgi:HEAT repeat protein